MDGIEKNILGINFTNFKLKASLSNLKFWMKALVSGNVNGNLILEDNNGASGINANFNILDLQALDIPLGI